MIHMMIPDQSKTFVKKHSFNLARLENVFISCQAAEQLLTITHHPKKIYKNIHAQATFLFIPIPSLFAKPIPTKTPVFNSQVTVWPMPSCKSLTSTMREWASDVSASDVPVKNGNMAQNLNCCHLVRNRLIFSTIFLCHRFLKISCSVWNMSLKYAENTRTI